MKISPPKRALQFLRWFCREDYLEEIEGDLAEVFKKEHNHSPQQAKWQFLYNVILHFRPRFLKIIQDQNVMKSILSIKKNPYVLLLFTTLALLFALAFRPIANIDFQDKTMFSIPLETMVWIIPLLLLSLWIFYLLTSTFLYSNTVTWIHVLITVITTFLIVAVLYAGINTSQFTSDRHELIGSVMQILSMLFVFGQLTYVANVLIGLSFRHND